MTVDLNAFHSRIPSTMLTHRYRLKQQLRSLKQAEKEGKPFSKNLKRFTDLLEQSESVFKARQQSAPKIAFTEDLPILERREEIAATIRDHQVVVVCGETGSGKSTQLPKIVLDLGRGIAGTIGHTQPRRIAARSIASRVAEELQCNVGDHVGFKIRFADSTSTKTHIKLMTDGILLAETQTDRFLDQYDTIIIDEAHERSLNIDLLIGYIKRILKKRANLKLIITSATIDADRFRDHFVTPTQDVPIINVSGRTFPVEVRYRPLISDDVEKADIDWQQGVADALDEVRREGPGDALVFLPTERDIRELAKVLRGRTSGAEILPLYGRLSMSDQNRVFRNSKTQRIVLATNVAESSLTVPGIRYVIDTGTARISRYSVRSRMQRLPIEAVSRASADQRKGRCGRVGPGICIRLYDEADFLAREEFTPPEIQRTSLAAVVLQTMSLRLGPIEEFPFLDPPKPTAVRDGYKTLFEVGAIDENNKLTPIGRQLSRIPADPRIGRMILAGADEGCLKEVLIIASALEIQDPRERPAEKRQQADTAHEQFQHGDSDFLSLLKLWDFFHGLKAELSQNRLRKMCKQNFISYNRMREWSELERQLRDILSRGSAELKAAAKALRNSERKDDYAAIHRALLTGLLSNVAYLSSEHEYSGAGGHKLFLWPGSGLFAKKPKWFMAAELVETTRRYARMAARIQPEWIEAVGEHLVKRNYSEPHWHSKSASVMAWEKVSLFGMPVVARRRKRYGQIDPVKSREMFIEHALVQADYESPGPFFKHNQQLQADAVEQQARLRQHDLVLGEEARYEFFDQRIPADISDGPRFEKWRKKAVKKTPRLLFMTMQQFIADDTPVTQDAAYPSQVDVGGFSLNLNYALQPGTQSDGITITVPQEALNQLDSSRLGWLVPGLMEEKITALIRTLPRNVRRALVPAPDTAREVVGKLQYGRGVMEDEVAVLLGRIAGQPIGSGDFDLTKLPDHLRMNVRVINGRGDEVAVDRDLTSIRKQHATSAAGEFAKVDDSEWKRDGLKDWEFDTLPQEIAVDQSGLTLKGYPGLVGRGESVSLRLFDNAAQATASTRTGLRRLAIIAERKRILSQVDNLPQIQQATLYAAAIPNLNLRESLTTLIANNAFLATNTIPRSRSEYDTWLKQGRQRLGIAAQDIAQLIGPLFSGQHKIRQELDRARAPQWRTSVADMTNQLNHLMAQDFLTTTPWTWLSQYPRYFRAIEERLKKLASGNLNRDQSHTEELQAWWQRYEESRARSYTTVVQQLRWMIEEYRVSLFAQQLGTAMKISSRRLEDQWRKTQ